MQRNRFDPWALVVLGVLLLAGCSQPLEPRVWERRMGLIEIGGEQPPPIQLPATARQGVPFTATVYTWGSGTCTRPDGAEVRVSGLTAEITPFDLKAVTGNCTDDLRPYTREVTLRFESAGEARIRVLGRVGTFGTTEYETRIAVLP